MQLNSKNNKIFVTKSKSSTVLVVSLLFIIFVSYFSIRTANAGLVFLMSSLFSGEKASAESNQQSYKTNSQTMTLLAAAANRDPNPDKLTDVLPVDEGGVLVADIALSSTAVSDSDNTQISTYIVREGDTVSSVAKMFNVSVNTILWANNISSKSVLKSGQTLVILPISGINYTIKKGDTLDAIAKKYKADKEEIMAYNDLSSASTIKVGQTIIIPDAELSVPQNTIASGPRKITKAPYEPLLDGWDWPSLPGYFTRPVIGGTKTQSLHGHNGIDIAAPAGTPLLASAAGTVIINRMNGAWNGGYGNYVVISHPNGTQTLYGHMLGSAVSVGDRVSKGEKIGYMGSTGLSTGPHVHFEIRGAKNPF